MMKQLMTGIYAKLSGSSLASKLTGGLHNSNIPAGTSFPYADFKLISTTRIKSNSSTAKEFLIRFNIFSESSTSDEALDIADLVTALYDESTLTVSGATFQMMSLDTEVMPQTGEKGIFQVSQSYRVLISV